MFLTGDHAYGVPKPDSNVDICVFAGDQLDITILNNIAGAVRFDSSGRGVVRIGRVNLIVFLYKDDYDRQKEDRKSVV